MNRTSADAFDCLCSMSQGKRAPSPQHDAPESLNEETVKRKSCVTSAGSTSASASLLSSWGFARQRFLQLLFLFG
jgi:hypothetical protein